MPMRHFHGPEASANGSRPQAQPATTWRTCAKKSRGGIRQDGNHFGRILAQQAETFIVCVKQVGHSGEHFNLGCDLVISAQIHNRVAVYGAQQIGLVATQHLIGVVQQLEPEFESATECVVTAQL